MHNKLSWESTYKAMQSRNLTLFHLLRYAGNTGRYEVITACKMLCGKDDMEQVAREKSEEKRFVEAD